MGAEPELSLTADGTSLGVTTLDGRGSVIVALHGFTGDGSTMRPLIERVRGDRSAILVDCIGHGSSDAPADEMQYSMSSVVDQVLSLVGPRPVGSVHLIGYSMGGRIALSMAARAPWYFASVTTLSATPGIADPIERAMRYEEDRALADRIETEGVEAFCDWWLSLPLFAPMVAALSAEQLERTLAQRRTNTAHGLANSLRGTGTGSMPPLWAMLPALQSPFLALAGAIDERYVSLAQQAASVARFGQAVSVAGAGHALHVENPDEVSHLLRGFLEGCDTAAREARPESSL
jgi:2-succinyl-6-hydroxy-2,4-cyclohexadiene-1-carboxylate synthase